jgi:hypothetical protein
MKKKSIMDSVTSAAIKKRFCKDFSIPIGIFEHNHFLSYLIQYDVQYNTTTKYQLLLDAIDSLGSEEAFMQEFNRIKDAIITDVSSTDGYHFLAITPEPRPYSPKYEHHKQNIYTSKFAGSQIISIDIKKANFTALKIRDEQTEHRGSILNGANTWSEFLNRYTTREYYHKSKQLRQVIFGNLLPKRQQSIQRSMCNEIADTIMDMDESLDVAIVSTDEILILNHSNPVEGVSAITSLLGDKLGYTADELRIEAFELEQVHPEKSYFVKKNLIDASIEFKSIPLIFFPQVFSRYFGYEITQMDKTFFHEGQLATFKTTIYNGYK